MKKTVLIAVLALVLGVSSASAQGGKTSGVAYQHKAGAAATQKANAASLKKGEPRLNASTTTTNVYNVSATDKRGTTDYGVMEQTVTNAQGSTTTNAVLYDEYTPSKAARVNERDMEVSVAGGVSYTFNKDDRKDRYAKNGFGANMNMLWNMTPNFAMGLDYMMLHPGTKSHNKDGQARNYKDFYLHSIALGGRYTLNAWDNWRVYLPMGWGMMQARMKTTTDAGDRSSKDKWGTGFYAGLGLQYDISTDLFAGLEYRYTYAFISDKHLSDFGRDKDLQFHSLFLRLGMRF